MPFLYTLGLLKRMKTNSTNSKIAHSANLSHLHSVSMGSTKPHLNGSTATTTTQPACMTEKPPSYYCQRCKNHGVLTLRKRHQIRCPFKTCSCQLCLLIDQRRVVMRTRNQISVMDGLPKYAQQMGMLAEKRKSNSMATNNKKIRKPRCFLCTGHGRDSELKNHKKEGCPYENCHCNTCTLGRQYRRLMAVQTKQRRYQSKDERNMFDQSTSSSMSTSSDDSTCISRRNSNSTDMMTPSKPNHVSNRKRPREDKFASTAATPSSSKQFGKRSFLIDDILAQKQEERAAQPVGQGCLDSIVRKILNEKNTSSTQSIEGAVVVTPRSTKMDTMVSLVDTFQQQCQRQFALSIPILPNIFDTATMNMTLSSQILLLMARQCHIDQQNLQDQKATNG